MSVGKLAASNHSDSVAMDIRLQGIENMIMKLEAVRGVDDPTLQTIYKMSNAIEHHHRQQEGVAATHATYDNL